MFVLLFYSIICDQYTFKDKTELTEPDVAKAMNKNKNITDVIIENITKIGDNAFLQYYN